MFRTDRGPERRGARASAEKTFVRIGRESRPLAETIYQVGVVALVALPALVIVALAILEGIVEIETVAGGLYLATHLLVLGIAAFGYERTDSLVVPTQAYASLLASIQVVLVAFEVGV